MNVELKKQDYRKNRKGDEKTLVAAMKMRHESTEDTIIKLVNEVARNYPNKKFVIEHDGIIKFSVKCDDQIIYIGDHYEIENMLKEGTYIFSNQLISRIEQIA